jgi:anthranilate phosphoribosyltransferase
VLEALGINISLEPEKTEKVIEQTGLGFLFAPLHHQAMKHAIKPRKEIGIRTVFNILGPIVNPAKAETRLLGAFNEETARKIAAAMQKLEIERALVVHGLEGLDELSTLGKSLVLEVNGSEIKESIVQPEDFGLKTARIEELAGGTPEENALILKKILEGENGVRRDIAVLNAGAAIYANKKAASIKEGVEMAANAIDSGAALKKLELIKSVSNA